MITINPETVREIMGPMANGIADSVISNDGMVVVIESEIAALCASWSEITDPEALERLNIAVGYLVAARLVGSSVEDVKSMSLGDQSITYSDGYFASARAGWKRDARNIMAGVCPIPDRAPKVGFHFGTARGRRG